MALSGFGLGSLIEIGASTVVPGTHSGTGEARRLRPRRMIGVTFIVPADYLPSRSRAASTSIARQARLSVPFVRAGQLLTTWWDVVLSVLGGLLVLWLALVLVLWIEQRRHPGGASLRDLLRLAPDVARLLKRLAGDRTVSIGVRIWLVILFVYLLSPIDLIPDFVPVLGYADDAMVVAVALRFATRRADNDAVKRHLPGTPEGLSTVLRLAGLKPSP